MTFINQRNIILFFILLVSVGFGSVMVAADEGILLAVTMIANAIGQRIIVGLSFLMFGILASALIAILLDAAQIKQWLPKNPMVQLTMALGLGFIFPVGAYGVVPVARRLRQKGLPLTMLVVFVLAAPLLNPIGLMGVYLAWGWGAIGLWQISGVLITALLIGVVFSFNQDSLDEDNQINDVNRQGAARGVARYAPTNVFSFISNGNAFWKAIREDSLLFGGLFVVGCAIAGSLQIVVSLDNLRDIGTLGVLQWQGYAFIADVQLMPMDALSSLAMGVLVAALVLGSMLNLISVVMLVAVFRVRVLVYVVVLVMLITLVMGVGLASVSGVG